MYKDADFVDSLFYCAPLWDMDNCFYASLREACSFYNRKHTGFISSLCSNPTFWNEVQAIYNNEFSPLLESFTTEIDSLYSVIKYDLDLDDLLYHRSVSSGVDVEYIKHFMDLRKDFLNNHFSSNADTSYCSVVVKSTPQELWMHPSEYIVQVGDTFSLEGIKTQYEGFNYIGCFYSDGRPFNPQEPIYSDLFISMKWESTNLWKRWKARIDQWRVDFAAYRRDLLK